jgi:integration host factor subunit alpha
MTKVLTKAHLVTSIREQEPSLSGTLAAQITNAFFEEIVSALEKGETVKLSGLGSFRVRNKKARPGRNPKTGVTVPVSPRKVVTFQLSQKVKDQLKNLKK